MDIIIEELKKLYKTYTGEESSGVLELPSSGSHRRYFRLFGTQTLIGVSGTSKEENNTFLYMQLTVILVQFFYLNHFVTLGLTQGRLST